jgi:maltooligosyltrehalose synthase
MPETRERMRVYAVKALREAKRHTSWTDPDNDYESACLRFLDTLLTPGAVAVICPVRMSFREIASALIFGVATLLVTIPCRGAAIGRWRGILLLGLYILYVAGMLS